MSTLKEQIAEVRKAKKQVETVKGYLQAIPEERRRALEEIAKREGYLSVEALAVGLLGKRLEGVNDQRARKVNRQRFGDEIFAKRYSALIVDTLNAHRDCEWIMVDKRSGRITAETTHPGSQKDFALIDCRDRDELLTAAGELTVASVAARILGYPRLDTRMEG